MLIPRVISKSPRWHYNGVMKLASFLLLLLVAVSAAAQAPADLNSEPHHQLLLQNSQARVYAITLRPLEQAYVRHEHNFLMVTLQTCQIVIWREGRSAIQNYQLKEGDVRFFNGGRALGLRNDRNNEFRSILIEFLDPNITTYDYQQDSGNWDYGDSVLRPPVDPDAKYSISIQFGAATAISVQLLPGDSLPPPEKEAVELFIPITDIDLKAGAGNRIRKAPGEAMWVAPGRKAKYINTDSEPARFVIVEFR